MNNKLVGGIIAVLVIGIAGYMLWMRPTVTAPTGTSANPVACTMDAKICPDGSSVGRQGPKCEFAPCPTTTSLKTFSDGKVTFMYPDKLSTEYISALDWPPKVTLANSTFSCTEAGLEGARAGLTERVTINGRVYCKTTEAEGAAGSTYLNYAYVTQVNNKLAYLTFSIRQVQCLNYNEPKASQCTAERNAFNIDQIIDGVVQTLTVVS
ncbi:MAG: hypothetical protein JWL80_391 [Parcubacteria group bacterium]|nr:hypothetical protein [Parcubacteria group bacterium]